MDPARRPNLFLVGAPRCGTTSLFSYLAEHPDVFGPAEKEPHFYDRDLLGPGGMTESEYEALFAGATRERWRIDASTLYLYSAAAPAAIKQDVPDAHILVALRDPVEFVASWHNLLVASGTETILDLGAALDAEPARRDGLSLPTNVAPLLLSYTELGRFTKYINRWEEAFGPERVHIVLLEDLEVDPASTGTRLLRLLGVDPSGAHSFPHLNPARRTFGAAVLAPLNRPSVLRNVARTVVPRPIRRYAWHRVTRALTPHGPRPPGPTAVRERLEAHFAAERELIDRVRAGNTMADVAAASNRIPSGR